MPSTVSVCKAFAAAAALTVWSMFLLSLSTRENGSHPQQTLAFNQDRHAKAAGRRELIFDIGFNSGEDTYMYMQHGFDVVAVEADRALEKAGRERFEAEIESGRLELHNLMLVGDEVLPERRPDGTMTFWVHRMFNEWSSIDKKQACKRVPQLPDEPSPCDGIQVQVMTCGELLAKHRTALYVKIDIEGADRDCLRSIAALPRDKRPLYISVEDGGMRKVPDDPFMAVRARAGEVMPPEASSLDVMVSMGYNAFKLVCQAVFAGAYSGPWGEFANNVLALPQEDGDGYGFHWSSEQAVRDQLPFGTSEVLFRKSRVNELTRNARIQAWQNRMKAAGQKPPDVSRFPKVPRCWWDIHAKLHDAVMTKVKGPVKAP